MSYRSQFRIERNYNNGTSLAFTPYARYVDLRFLRHFVPGQALEKNRHTSVGLQSAFYSKNFNGILTSNGDVFSNTKLTAACNLFKLNTIVRVTNLRTGANVMVRVNDRMHPRMLQKGRIIDLSQAASKKLITNAKGIVKVSIEAIGYSKTTPKS